MIDVVTIEKEREAKLASLQEQYNKELVTYRQNQKEKIDTLCMDFALTHTQEETDSYRSSLEEKASISYSKKETRLKRKLAYYQSKEERQDNAFIKHYINKETLDSWGQNKIDSYVAKQDKKIAKYQEMHNEEEVERYKARVAMRIDNYSKSIESRKAKKLSSSKRIWELDFLRGVAIWGMIFDHLMWDFYQLFNEIFANYYAKGSWTLAMSNFANRFWNSDFRIAIRLFGVFLFIFLCGISSQFSKNNLKRGLMILGVGLIVTGTLYFVSVKLEDSGLQILLSTLTTIGLCIIFYALAQIMLNAWVPKKYHKWIILGVALFILIGWGIVSSLDYLYWSPYAGGHSVEKLLKRFYFIFNNHGDDIGWFSGYENLNLSNLYRPILGLEGFGSDWLGLFPYVGYIFLGGFVGETVYHDRKSIIKYFYHKEDRSLTGDAYLESRQGQLNARMNKYLSPIIVPGKNTFYVYVLHQPVLILLFIIPMFLTGHPLSF